MSSAQGLVEKLVGLKRKGVLGEQPRGLRDNLLGSHLVRLTKTHKLAL